MWSFFVLLCVGSPASATPWGSISPLLERSDGWGTSYLPTVPPASDGDAVYGSVAATHSDGYPFASYTISLDAVGLAPDGDSIVVAGAAAACNDSEPTAIKAGPSFICPSGEEAGSCSGPGFSAGVEVCQARHVVSGHAKFMQLGGRAGTHWAPALGIPAWAQYMFPATPAGTSSLTLRYRLDARYRPELYGGNPCPNASPTYNCTLCTKGPWDFAQPPGVYLLWSAAGRSDYVVSGPYGGHGEAFDAGVLTHVVDAPEALELREGEFPIVAFLTVSQYGAQGEVVFDGGRCTVGDSDDGYAHAYRDHPFILERVTALYRQSLSLPTTPPTGRPRLYGTDDVWYPQRVLPFFDAPCDADAASSAGWFEAVGVLDMKARFERAARGFLSCSQSAKDGGDITWWSSVKKFIVYDPTTPPTFTDGRRCLHLLRRLWACAELAGGSYDGCEYSETEAARLASALVRVEVERFAATDWSCGASCGGDGSATFDLDTAGPVEYYALWYDVLSSRPGLLPSANATLVQATLRAQIDLFRQSFNQGGWQLWNGNNWTPHLTIAALMWAVAFYHEDSTAPEVVRMVNDILWLHRPYYTADGVYTEGVSMYSFMSIAGLVETAVVQRLSFGAAPLAIDVPTLRKVVKWHVASMATDGYLVDFGDSHAKRGWDDTSTYLAAAASTIVGDVPFEAAPPALESCDVRALSASLYGSGGVYDEPWNLEPALLDLDLGGRARACETSATPAQPLGARSIDLFPDGGFGAIRLPLLPSHEADGGARAAPCFGAGAQERCVDAALPSLFDNVPYAYLALQARPNDFAHSEVDFGTLIWSAWGARLLTDFGYGTIATAVGQWDTRRYTEIDNNPAGHNTVVVREAFASEEERINFSQMNKGGHDGTIGAATDVATDADVAAAGAATGPLCVELDGSQVYGAGLAGGWLDTMRRYACALDAPSGPSDPLSGAILLIDVLAVKPHREALHIYGAQYGGPSFDEAEPPSHRLHLEEYFHTDTCADLETDAAGQLLAREIAWDRAALGTKAKWCRHVNMSDAGRRGAMHLLRLTPGTGIGSYRDPDGLGAIGGYAARGGSFVVDGLVTAPDRWQRAHHLKKRRFRFVGADAIDASGDVRAFLLAPSLAHDRMALPSVAMDSCTEQLGCPSVDAPLSCSCVSVCVGSRLQWAAVVNGRLALLRTVGSCALGPPPSPELVESLDAALVAEVRALVALPPGPSGANSGGNIHLQSSHATLSFGSGAQQCRMTLERRADGTPYLYSSCDVVVDATAAGSSGAA